MPLASGKKGICNCCACPKRFPSTLIVEWGRALTSGDLHTTPEIVGYLLLDAIADKDRPWIGSQGGSRRDKRLSGYLVAAESSWATQFVRVANILGADERPKGRLVI